MYFVTLEVQVSCKVVRLILVFQSTVHPSEDFVDSMFWP
jgi:hypothetical protein